jgi:hypothetical protein
MVNSRPLPSSAGPLSLFYKQIAVRFQAGKNSGARAWGNQFLFIFASNDLEKFHTAGTKMGAPINGVWNNSTAVADKKPWIYKIGVIGRVREIKKVIILDVRSKSPCPTQIYSFFYVFDVVPFFRKTPLKGRIPQKGLLFF